MRQEATASWYSAFALKICSEETAVCSGSFGDWKVIYSPKICDKLGIDVVWVTMLLQAG